MKTEGENIIAAAIEDAEDVRNVGDRPTSNSDEAAAKFAQRPVPPADLIVLPNDNFSFSDSARSVFTKLASTKRYFARGGAVVELITDRDGSPLLSVVTPSALRSRLDREARHVMAYVLIRSSLALRSKRCSHSNAEALLATIEARDILPPIRLVTCAAIIVPDHNGPPMVLGCGYHAHAGGRLVTSDTTPPHVEPPEAVRALRALLIDFDFASPGDEARALAAVITPALKMGGWLRDPAPIDVAEANASLAGKGLRQRLTRTIYHERAYLIAQREGGVGSVDESLSAALLSGRPFVALDNIRGRLDSKSFEAIITWGDAVPVRVPHRGEIHVDASAVTFQLSSNGVEATRDLINRAAIVRNRKRPKDHKFHAWPEGDLVTHVEAQAAFYLGCVFAVIRAWAEKGQPRLPLTTTGFHDFREWAGVLGWIVQELFGTAPLLEGHEAAQARAADPALSWVRALCLATEHAVRLDQDLSASALAELSEAAGLDLPGLRGPATDVLARQHVGKLLARCFRGSVVPNRIAVDDFEVQRTETTEYDGDRRRDVVVRRYRIVRPMRPEGVTPTKEMHVDESTGVRAHRAQRDF